MYDGMRTMSGMKLLMSEMMRLEKMSTAMVANPIDMPLRALEVVPSVGHMPRSSTKVGFSLTSPFQNTLI